MRCKKVPLVQDPTHMVVLLFLFYVLYQILEKNMAADNCKYLQKVSRSSILKVPRKLMKKGHGHLKAHRLRYLFIGLNLHVTSLKFKYLIIKK